MPTSHGLRGFVAVDGDRQEFLLSDDPTHEQMRASGRWLSTAEPVEVDDE